MSDRINSPSRQSKEVKEKRGFAPLTLTPDPSFGNAIAPEETKTTPLEPSPTGGRSAKELKEKITAERGKEKQKPHQNKTDQAFIRVIIGGAKKGKKEKEKEQKKKDLIDRFGEAFLGEDYAQSVEDIPVEEEFASAFDELLDEGSVPPDKSNPLGGQSSAIQDYLTGDIAIATTTLDVDFETVEVESSQGFLDESAELEISDNITLSSPPSDVDEAQSVPRKLEFDSCYGQILTDWSWVKEDTHQLNQAQIVLYDPQDELRLQLAKYERIEIELGFVNGYILKKFEGAIYRIGRIYPIGTLLECVDESAKLKASDTGVTDKRTPTPKQSGIDRLAEAVLQEGAIAKDIAIAETEEDFFDLSSLNSDGSVGTSSGGLTDLFDSVTTGGSSTSDTLAEAIPGQGTSAPITEEEKKKTTRRRISAEAALEDREDIGLALVQEGDSKTDEAGETRLGQSRMDAISQEAAREGKKVSVRDGQLAITDPGKEPDSGVILDLKSYPDLIIGNPKFRKSTGLVLSSGFGGVMLKGMDIAGKQTIGSVVVAGQGAFQHPTGKINPPEWGSIKLSDPIVPGSPYTWGDATKNGARVPQTKEIMGGIIRIARIISQYTEQVGKGKWRINSWYRDPASNRACGGATQSRHLSGDAVDVNFSGMASWHKSLFNSWEGGLAISPGSFIHIDDRGERSRWTY